MTEESGIGIVRVSFLIIVFTSLDGNKAQSRVQCLGQNCLFREITFGMTDM